MGNIISQFANVDGFGSANLQCVFDAERDTPALFDAVASVVPEIRGSVAGLRESLPLVPHSGVGPIGRSGFYRLPNHYRSVSCTLPSDSCELETSRGVIVFKGTEPLIADFPAYFDWMLGAPFRGSPLSMALHFPLDMKLPPAAMWIEECMAEQAVTSRVQQLFLDRHDRLARLPLPLFVFKMTPQQNARYEEVIRARLPGEAMKKIRNKLIDGLGVEVYYYPELPVRVADLFVGNVRETFRRALIPEQIEATCHDWAKLFAELLCLDYMPYVPWHHGMGGCVDQGNVCIDGGFNDLLTLSSFDAIPGNALFRRSLLSSIQLLADSMVAMSAASIGLPAVAEPDAGVLAASYVTEQVRQHVSMAERNGWALDMRLKSFLDAPNVADIAQLLRNTHRARGRSAQFIGAMDAEPGRQERASLEAAVGA